MGWNLYPSPLKNLFWNSTLGLQLKLPMESNRMKEALHHVHSHQNPHRSIHPNREPYDHPEDAARLNRAHHGQVKEHLLLEREYIGQLRVCQGQGPKTQVGGCVRNRSQHEFDRLYHLVNHHFSKGLMVIVGCLLLFVLVIMVIGKQHFLGG